MQLNDINLPLVEDKPTTSVTLAHCMWLDEKEGETYEADLRRVSDGEGNEWWEVDRTVTSNALYAAAPETAHTEYDDETAAYEDFLKAVKMTITRKES